MASQRRKLESPVLSPLEAAEKRRRRREKITVALLSVVLALFTAVEIHLLKTSAQLPFVNSIFFFGLMNLNLVLIMVLLFLVFRNAVKLILDERRRKRATRLKTRLVFSFILFAIIPSVLLFSISAFYIRSSFDKWFNAKMEGTLQRSIEVVRNYYETAEKNAAHFARRIGFSITSESHREPLLRLLEEARLRYGLDGVEYYADPFSNRLMSVSQEKAEFVHSVPLGTLRDVFASRNKCHVQNVGGGELIRCGLFLGVGKGAIFASYFFPMSLAFRLSDIQLTYDDYKSNNPLQYPIKSAYFAILLMATLLILFSATWTGFYVARRLAVPIEELAKGTAEVARGNLDYKITPSGSEEFYQLIESFNQMTGDLQESKKGIEDRRRYIEVLLESVQSGVVSLDEKGRITMVNGAASSLLRRPSEEILGKPYWALVPQEHRSELKQVLRALFQTSKSVRRELRFRGPQGTITLLVTLSALRDESKRQMGVVAVLDDVTEIQKMERMAAWREIAKRIAHEIKNPLTPIQLSVQRLRRRYLDKIDDDGTFDEATHIVLNEVGALKKLVGEFSTFARLPEIQQNPESLKDIVAEAANLFRAGHESILFEFVLAEDLPKLQLDRAQVKRVLINLFDNAIDAMGGKGTITVKTWWDTATSSSFLMVADEGCGISQGMEGRLFEPYFSTKQEGTGLGLAIVHRIVSDHGASVRVVPNHPKGSRFVIEFPESLVATELRLETVETLSLDGST